MKKVVKKTVANAKPKATKKAVKKVKPEAPQNYVLVILKGEREMFNFQTKKDADKFIAELKKISKKTKQEIDWYRSVKRYIE